MRRAYAVALVPSPAVFLAAFLAALLAQTGCFIEENCDAIPERAASVGLFNPESGQCEFFGGGGGGGGGGLCGDFGGGADEPAPAPAPDWVLCVNECTGLSESTCLESRGCRATYVSNCPELADCNEVTYTFSECYAMPPSGAIRGGTCSGLGAEECSRHDDCVALHYPDSSTSAPSVPVPPGNELPALGRFERCASEQPGQNVSCFAEVFCDGLAPVCPPNTVAAVSNGCYLGSCIPVDQCEVAPSCGVVPTEAACIAQETCSAIYVGRDCSCDPAGNCSCQTQEYDRCQDA